MDMGPQLQFPSPSWLSSPLQFGFDLQLTSHVNGIDADNSWGYLVPHSNPGVGTGLFICQPRNTSLEPHSLDSIGPAGRCCMLVA